MRFVTLTTLRDHCRADTEDDALLTIYGDAAERSVEMLANRYLYVDAATHNTEVDLLPAKVAAARDAYKADMDAAAAIADDVERDFAKSMALDALNRVLIDAQKVRDGLVITEDMKAAILLIAGSLYRNREEVATGVSVTQIPVGAHAIMSKYCRVAV